MTVWTRDAKELLEDYLTQVAILLSDTGEDAKAVTAELRGHVTEEAEAAGLHTVTVDNLRAVLRRIGSPAEVAGLEEPPVEKAAPEPQAASAPHREPLGVREQSEGIQLKIVLSDRERRTATVVGIGCIIAGLLFLVAMAAMDAYRPKVVQGEEVCLAEPEDVKPAQPRAVAAEAYTYSDQAVLDNSSDYFIEKMARPEPGYHRLAGLWAFGNKGRRASQSELRDMLETALRTAQDPAKPFQQRFQCVYAVSGFEQPWLVPPLAEMLESDPNSKLRGVLACALGHFDDPAADEALREALRSESDPAVRSWIERALAGAFPRPTSPVPAD